MFKLANVSLVICRAPAPSADIGRNTPIYQVTWCCRTWTWATVHWWIDPHHRDHYQAIFCAVSRTHSKRNRINLQRQSQPTCKPLCSEHTVRVKGSEREELTWLTVAALRPLASSPPRRSLLCRRYGRLSAPAARRRAVSLVGCRRPGGIRSCWRSSAF